MVRKHEIRREERTNRIDLTNFQVAHNFCTFKKFLLQKSDKIVPYKSTHEPKNSHDMREERDGRMQRAARETWPGGKLTSASGPQAHFSFFFFCVIFVVSTALGPQKPTFYF